MVLLDASAALHRNGDIVPPPERAMPSAREVAKYFLLLAEEEDLVSNHKLQKLLYYAQGFHLAMYRTPLFREALIAWNSGPAVPEVWKEYEEYGLGALPRSWVDLDAFTTREAGVIKDVYTAYGQFAAWVLRDLVHGESPFTSTPHHGVISHKKLAAYFVHHLLDDPDDAPPA
ncbi:Panacea domain-containing protein [Noviluteimonas gilva]|uniref:DUF4065 domain-containing protein n=1 Tax=Noviluteimonas gilva TaxID=2682097 RepID=A0A7C9I467_9GAMM|nr:type II toxin-antitoxin system antitoxin SocA domain-containing protein [Lysobacter gilvus]MUV13489.1 DUF4065 domain-containing protein [Lysobacter gilvus]